MSPLSLGAVRTQQEGTPGRGPSVDTEFAGTLILGLPGSRTVRKTSLWCSLQQPEMTKMPSLYSPQGLCTGSSLAQECSFGNFQLILILQLKCHLFSENFPVTLLQVGPSSAPPGPAAPLHCLHREQWGSGHYLPSTDRC